MSRTMPTECPHGKTIDWGDFGEPEETEACELCGIPAGNADAPVGESGIACSTCGRTVQVATWTTMGFFCNACPAITPEDAMRSELQRLGDLADDLAIGGVDSRLITEVRAVRDLYVSKDERKYPSRR